MRGAVGWLALRFAFKKPGTFTGTGTFTGAIFLIATLIFVAIFADFISPFAPSTMDGSYILSPPSFASRHYLGTDALGRDVASRLIFGTRAVLFVTLVAVTLLSGIGIALGSIAGFFRGSVDAVVSRTIEAISAFPTIVLVVVVQAIVPDPSIVTLLATIALTRWTEVAQLVRSETLAASTKDYTLAARALGAPPWRIMWRHVLPNISAAGLVSAAFAIANTVLILAQLDFLHLGLPDDTASWGGILSGALENTAAWWLILAPGFAIFATVVAINTVGDRLRQRIGRAI